MSRNFRTTLASVLGVGAMVVLPAMAQTPAPNPYHTIENWAKLPAGMEWGQVSGVELDGQGNLWVIHRADPPILEFDASGKFIKSLGTGMFVQAHSLHFDRDGNLWATDGQAGNGKGNVVYKFSADGKLLLTLGKAGATGDGTDVFNGVCDIVSAPNGDVFIADGHTNARVLKFSKDGKFIASWGKKGTGPGEFDVPHAIAMDSAGRVFVGDRSNYRIQIFDQNGKYLTEWKQFGRPTGLSISKDDTIYVADDESNSTRNPAAGPGIYVGSARDGSLKAFIPVGNTERAVADAQGNIYTAVLGGRRSENTRGEEDCHLERERDPRPAGRRSEVHRARTARCSVSAGNQGYRRSASAMVMRHRRLLVLLARWRGATRASACTCARHVSPAPRLNIPISTTKRAS